MDALSPAKTALLIIDVQKGFDEFEANGGRRNNPDALARIAGLLAAFRGAGLRVIHVHHASTGPNSVFRPERPGFAAMDAVRPAPGETVIVKTVNAAFIGTDLEARLRAAGITTLFITGATTNHCVETTTRMAGNLGFDTKLVRDATWAYDQTGADGEPHTAAAIHAMTLSNLNGEFAEIVSATEVIRRVATHQPARKGTA